MGLPHHSRLCPWRGHLASGVGQSRAGAPGSAALRQHFPGCQELPRTSQLVTRGSGSLHWDGVRKHPGSQLLIATLFPLPSAPPPTVR